MTTLKFESHSPLFSLSPSHNAPFGHARRRRKKLALISTRDELCGIAAYTRSLERQLGDIFDVRVFDLDQYLLRSTHGRITVRWAGPATISTDAFLGYYGQHRGYR